MKSGAMKFRDRLAVRMGFVVAAAVIVAAIMFAVMIWGAIWYYDASQYYKLSPALEKEAKDLYWRYMFGEGLNSAEIARRDEITRQYYNSPTEVEQLVTLVILLTSCCIVATSVVVMFVHRLVDPILAAEEQARRAASGEFSVRVAPMIVRRQRGELDQLVRDFDTLLETVERNDRALRDNNKAIAQELEAPIAEFHEALLALREAPPGAWGQLAAPLIVKVGLLAGIIDDLRVISLAQAHKLILNSVDIELGDLVSGAAAKFQPAAAQRGVEITQDAANISLSGDAARLEQALGRLIESALRQLEQGGRLHIEGVVSGDMFCLRVLNGMERFSDAPHPVIRAIAEAHGGGVGDGFEIRLPLEGHRR
jgi:signal transduction histidine kinase